MALNQTDIFAIVLVLASLATIAVAARLWVRSVTKARYGVDDWTILVSLILMWAMSGTILRGAATSAYGSHAGAFRDPQTHRPIYDGPIYDAMIKHTLKFHMTIWISTILFLGLVKISVVLLYRRLFRPKRAFMIYSVVLLFVLALWTLGFAFAKAFQCGTKMWFIWTNSEDRDRICYASDPISNGYTISDVITDLVVVVSPIPVLWGIHLTIAQRFAVMGIFAMGFLSTAAGAVRAYVLLDINYNVKPGLEADFDIVVIVTKIAVLSHAEIAVAIIAACLPTLRPLVIGDYPCNLVRKLKPSFSSSGTSMRKSELRSSSKRFSNVTKANGAVWHNCDMKLEFIPLQEPGRVATRERYNQV